MYGTSSDPNLRRRNDYFAPAEGGSFSDMAYPPYSELPFTSLKRRKQGTNFVKWTMRAVLASPIVVLVVWSTFAILFSSKHVHNSSSSSSQGGVKSSNNNKQRRNTGRNPINSMYEYNIYNPYLQGQPTLYNNNNLNMAMQQQQQQQQPLYGSAPLQLQQQQDASQGLEILMMQSPQQQLQQQQQQQVVMMNAPSQQNIPQAMMMNPPLQQQQQQQQQQQMMAIPQSMLANEGAALQQNQMMAQQQQQQVQNQQVDVNKVMTPEQFLTSRGSIRRGNSMPVIAPLGSSIGGGEQQVQQPIPMGNTNAQMITQPAALEAAQQPMGQREQLQQGEAPMGQVRIEPLQQQGSPPLGMGGGGGGGNITQANPLGQEAVVYYYYPSHAIDSYGNVKVPSVIFDRKGNPVDLKALQGKRVYMTPPKSRTLSVSSIPKWGESSSQDQSIIISTVAVMALLVGALSARRMRARSFLSACIENESLEDDVAYDTATTEANSYNTFGGWKGDLEKFDV